MIENKKVSINKNAQTSIGEDLDQKGITKKILEIIQQIEFTNLRFIKKKISLQLKMYHGMLILYQKQLKLLLIELVILDVHIVMLVTLQLGVRILINLDHIKSLNQYQLVHIKTMVLGQMQMVNIMTKILMQKHF